MSTEDYIPPLYQDGNGNWVLLDSDGKKYHVATKDSRLGRAIAARTASSADRYAPPTPHAPPHHASCREDHQSLVWECSQCGVTEHAAPTIASSTTESSERAWLIEMPSARWGTGYFWKGIHEYGQWGVIEEAVRFSRKEDAERVIESMKKYRPYLKIELEACEHEWPGGLTIASATKESSNG